MTTCHLERWSNEGNDRIERVYLNDSHGHNFGFAEFRTADVKNGDGASFRFEFAPEVFAKLESALGLSGKKDDFSRFGCLKEHCKNNVQDFAWGSKEQKKQWKKEAKERSKFTIEI